MAHGASDQIENLSDNSHGITIYVTSTANASAGEIDVDDEFVVIGDENKVFEFHEAQLEKEIILAQTKGDCSTCGSPSPSYPSYPSYPTYDPYADLGYAIASSCVLVSEVYNSTTVHEVIVLRAFRDRYLMQFRFGRKFIAWYYDNGPKMARVVKRAPFLKPVLKPVLWVIACLVSFGMKDNKFT